MQLQHAWSTHYKEKITSFVQKAKTYLFILSIQYHRGRTTNHEVWLFGMVDVSQQLAMEYMQIVPDRTAQTLLPIIQRHTLPNTTVHSDQWQSYNRVQTLPNVSSYSTVNHSLHFVDPATGVHTQNIESYWGKVKLKFKRMKGCHASQLPSYLDEFMWRERYSNAEPFCRSVIMLFYHLYADLEGLHQCACRTLFRTSCTSTLCPELTSVALSCLRSHCNHLNIIII